MRAAISLQPQSSLSSKRSTLSRALGRAVAECWSHLSQDAQQNLFEAAIKSEGEKIRQQLAIFLHGRRQRTIDAVHSQATLEPDSLGG
jgi:hypothetical protein